MMDGLPLLNLALRQHNGGANKNKTLDGSCESVYCAYKLLRARHRPCHG